MDLGFLPVGDNVLSTLYPDSFRDVVLMGDSAPLFHAAKCIVQAIPSMINARA